MAPKDHMGWLVMIIDTKENAIVFTIDSIKKLIENVSCVHSLNTQRESVCMHDCGF